MPDITAEQLAEALTEFHLWVRPDRTQNVTATGIFGIVEDPVLVADALLAQISADAAHDVPPPMRHDAPAPDPELAAIGAIMAALAALDDADAVERVIAYVAHRCNVTV